MQSWDEVRLGLMALGYRRVLTVEIVCIAHGTFRGAIEDEQDFYLCPECQSPCTLALVVEGFSRHELPPWEKRVKGLSDKAREWIMCENFLDDRGFLAQQCRQRHENDRYHRIYGNRRKATVAAVP